MFTRCILEGLSNFPIGTIFPLKIYFHAKTGAPTEINTWDALIIAQKAQMHDIVHGGIRPILCKHFCHCKFILLNIFIDLNSNVLLCFILKSCGGGGDLSVK